MSRALSASAPSRTPGLPEGRVWWVWWTLCLRTWPWRLWWTARDFSAMATPVSGVATTPLSESASPAGMHFCQSCANVHKNSSATRHHKGEDLSTMTPERLAASQPAFCRPHSDKPAELFCSGHDAVVGQLCGTARHRACRDVVFFEQRTELNWLRCPPY